jgi:hypothetical protein
MSGAGVTLALGTEVTSAVVAVAEALISARAGVLIATIPTMDALAPVATPASRTGAAEATASDAVAASVVVAVVEATTEAEAVSVIVTVVASPTARTGQPAGGGVARAAGSASSAAGGGAAPARGVLAAAGSASGPAGVSISPDAGRISVSPATIIAVEAGITIRVIMVMESSIGDSCSEGKDEINSVVE